MKAQRPSYRCRSSSSTPPTCRQTLARWSDYTSAEAELCPAVRRHEIEVVRVPLDVAADERAVRQHLPATRTRLVEHVVDELGCKAAALESGLGLGVQERPRLVVVVILDESGKIVVGPDLDPVLF